MARTLAKKLTNYESMLSVGSIMRRRRSGPLLDLIERAFAEHGSVSVIDIGGTPAYWNIVPAGMLQDKRVHITLVNLPGAYVSVSEEHFSSVEADGCDLHMFNENAFHIAHSNSVLEHVGDWDRMQRFAAEVSRVAQCFFVQTPNYWFPLEPHCMTPFFHWLPFPLRVALVQRFALGHWERTRDLDSAMRTVEGVRLLDRKMLEELFDDSEILPEKLLFLTKSMTAVGR